MNDRTLLPLASALLVCFGMAHLVACEGETKPHSPVTAESSSQGRHAAASASPEPSVAPTSATAPATATASAEAIPSAPPEASAAASTPAATTSAAPTASAAPKATAAPKAAPAATASAAPSAPPATASATPSARPASPPTASPAAPPAEVKIEVGAAKPGSADEVAAKVDTIYVPIQRFRARFEQKYTAKIAGTEKKSSGVVYIKRPGKLSFSYHRPNKNRVVSDGVTLKIYEHENKQMFVKPVATTEYPGALAFIMGKGLRHSFSFTFNEAANWEGGPVIVGTPRVPNPGYEKVLFYIDRKLLEQGDPACVRRVLVLDAQGNRNRFDFIHVEQPASIGDQEFVFEAPPGTNILE